MSGAPSLLDEVRLAQGLVDEIWHTAPPDILWRVEQLGAVLDDIEAALVVAPIETVPT